MRISDQVVELASKYSSATFHEAFGKRGNLPSAIKPIDPTTKLCGRALTVLSPPRDNLWLHNAIYAAEPGDILVVDVGNEYEAGYWGEIMAYAAMERKIAGLIIDGSVRDADRMVEMGFPVFARGLCIRGTDKDKEAYGAINQPVRIGETVVFAGDLVFGDRDGVVIIPQNRVEEVIEQAEDRELKEAQIIKRIQAGERTLDIYNLN